MTIQTPAKPHGSSTLARRTSVVGRPTRLFSRDPFQSFDAMRQMLDSMFETGTLPELRTEFVPAVNLFERNGTYTLECEVPGYKKDDITVEARGDEVTISGSYSEEKNEGDNHYHRREIRSGSFSRTVALPQEVDPERVAAKLENGILKIELRPTHAIKSKTVPISG